MKLTRGKSSPKGVIVTQRKSGSLVTVSVPGQGKVHVVNRDQFTSAKHAAGARLSQAIANTRPKPIS